MPRRDNEAMSDTLLPPLETTDPGLRYRRVAALLRNDILTGKLAPAQRLPSIQELAAQCEVAPATIRQAIALLAEEGLLRSRQGSGTYVTEAPPARRPPIPLDLGWPAIAERIRGNKARILEADDTPPPLLPQDGVLAPAYRRMRRVHTTPDGLPYVFVELFVSRAYYDQAPRRFDREMALPLLEELGGAQLTTMRQSFRLDAADAETARQLDLKLGAPIGWLRRALSDRDGVVAYFSIGRVRADAVVFETVFTRP
jgi:GntR family transcriptional regulator